jgi:aromatase
LEHSTWIRHEPARVFDMILSVDRWPEIFPSCKAAAVLEQGEGSMLIELTARIGGGEHTARSRRQISRAAWRIDFQQESPLPPLQAASGFWQVLPEPGLGCRVVLSRDCTVTDGSGRFASVHEAEQWIRQVLDSSSRAELEALEAACERERARDAGRREEVFEHEVTVQAPVEFVYALLWEVERWPSLLPHVRRVTVREQTADYQDFEMEAAGSAGPLISRSIRRGVAERRIQYEQLQPPPLLRSHRGIWLLEPLGDGVRVTARQTLELEPDQIAPALGRPCSLPEARLLVSEWVGNHVRATLQAVKDLAERQHSVLWDGDSA